MCTPLVVMLYPFPSPRRWSFQPKPKRAVIRASSLDSVTLRIQRPYVPFYEQRSSVTVYEDDSRKPGAIQWSVRRRSQWD